MGIWTNYAPLHFLTIQTCGVDGNFNKGKRKENERLQEHCITSLKKYIKLYEGNTGTYVYIIYNQPREKKTLW